MSTTNFPAPPKHCPCGAVIKGATILIAGKGRPVCFPCALTHCMRAGVMK